MKMKPTFEVPKRAQSEFNYALAFLETINAMFLDIMRAKAEKELDVWSVSLLNLYCALVSDINANEREARYKEARQIMDECNVIMRRQAQNELSGIDIPRKLYWQMVDYEIWLRKIVEDAGYQTKRKRDILEPDEEW